MKRSDIGFAVVSTTVAGLKTADRLANLIVHARLAACVQRVPVRSVYRWKGRIESAPEYLLLAKTRRPLVRKLSAFIRKNHSYELPEVTVMPITGGLAGYLDWIAEETTREGRETPK